MTITLEPGTEARLRQRAAQEDRDAEALANQLLTEVLTDKVEPTSETTVREREAPVSEEEKKAAFCQAMIAAGLLTRIPPPRDPSKAKRPLITVQGEPVSETIIRERR